MTDVCQYFKIMILGVTGKSCWSMIILIYVEIDLFFHLDRKSPKSVFALVYYEFEMNHLMCHWGENKPVCNTKVLRDLQLKWD